MIIDTTKLLPCAKASRLKALCFIAENPGCYITQIAEAVGVTTACSTGLIDVMESDRLAMRICDPDDRRKWVIELTNQGKAIIEKIQVKEVEA